MRELYASYLVDDAAAPPNFSLATYGGSRPTLKPALFAGGCALLRSRSTPRLLHRLDLELAAVDSAADPRAVEVAGLAALVINGAAHLFPAHLAEPSTAAERLFPAARSVLASSRSLRISLRTGELLIPAGLIAADAAKWGPPPGRYPITRLHWSMADPPPVATPAGQVVHLLRRIPSFEDVAPDDVLSGLARMPADGIDDLLPIGVGEALRHLHDRVLQDANTAG